MSILNVNTIQPIGSGTTVTVAATELKTSNFITVGTGASVTSPSANVLTLGTNNAERLRIDSAGLVGIGTVSPSGSIHAHTASGTQRSYLEASASHSFLRLKSGSTSYNSGVEFFSGASNIANINGLGAGGLQFEVNGSERLRIASNGTTTVTEGLVLDGQNGSGKGLRLDLAGSSDYVIQETTTDDVVQFGGTGSSNFFTHNISSGSVGIATAVPSYRLDIGNGVNDPANGYQLRVNAAGDYIFALQRQSVPSFSIRNNSTGIVHLNTQNSKILSLGVSSGNASGSIEDDVRIDSNGHLTVRDGNLVIGTSGHGIDFSAAGNASGMSSELLDDYEEGTWTPTITGLGNHNNNAGSTWGKYTKIGNRVFITFRYQWTSRTTTNGGVVFLGSLPFSASNDSKSDAVYIGGLEGVISNSGREVYGGQVVYNTNTIQFRASGHNTSENSLFGSLSTSMSSGYIYGGANYIV